MIPSTLFQVMDSSKRKKDMDAVMTGIRLVKILDLAVPMVRTPVIESTNAIEEQKTAKRIKKVKFLTSFNAVTCNDNSLFVFINSKMGVNAIKPIRFCQVITKIGG